MIKNENNIEEILQESIDQPESSLGLDQYNNSHYFMCPLFNTRAVLRYPNNYIGSYIQDNGRKSTIDCSLYCLFKFKDINDEPARSINSYFINHPLFVFSYYAGTNEGSDLIMYTLRADEVRKRDYNHIINGRYSKTSIEYRKSYRSFGFSKGTVMFIDNITMKRRRFKKDMEDAIGESIPIGAELWNVFEPHREVFRYNEKKRQ